jgi:hypothetical protein
VAKTETEKNKLAMSASIQEGNTGRLDGDATGILPELLLGSFK